MFSILVLMEINLHLDGDGESHTRALAAVQDGKIVYKGDNFTENLRGDIVAHICQYDDKRLCGPRVTIVVE